MATLQIFIFIFILLKSYYALQSPCPKYFVFEPKKSEDDRWYGLLTLKSDIYVKGVTLDIQFDKSIIQTFLGAVSTNSDNTKFTIKNQDIEILANIPLEEEIYVVYDPYYDIIPPNIVRILLNGREICPTYEEQTVTVPVNNRKPTILVNINLPKCGTTIINGVPLITEGQHTRPGQWPWHSAIYRNIGNKKEYICGGTLVTEHHILTAAHCTVDKDETPRDAQEFTIILGKYGLFVSSQNEQVKNVSKITVHPNFNSSNFFNDISIIHLAQPAKFSKFVNPCCLWAEDGSIKSVVNRIGSAVGWGRDHNNNPVTDLLMQAQMPVVDTLSCIYAHREFYSLFTNDNNFCAGFRNGTSVCNGDSGGGLFFTKSGTSGANTVWQIRGIVSNTVAKDGFICDPNYYVIFTDVAKYLDWIEKITKQ